MRMTHFTRAVATAYTPGTAKSSPSVIYRVYRKNYTPFEKHCSVQVAGEKSHIYEKDLNKSRLLHNSFHRNLRVFLLYNLVGKHPGASNVPGLGALYPLGKNMNLYNQGDPFCFYRLSLFPVLGNINSMPQALL